MKIELRLAWAPRWLLSNKNLIEHHWKSSPGQPGPQNGRLLIRIRATKNHHPFERNRKRIRTATATLPSKALRQSWNIKRKRTMPSVITSRDTQTVLKCSQSFGSIHSITAIWTPLGSTTLYKSSHANEQFGRCPSSCKPRQNKLELQHL